MFLCDGGKVVIDDVIGRLTFRQPIDDFGIDRFPFHTFFGELFPIFSNHLNSKLEEFVDVEVRRCVA